MSSHTDVLVGAFRIAAGARGVSIRYERDAAYVELIAVPGSSDDNVEDDYGAARDIDEQDWLIVASDLVLNEAVVLPSSGDRLVFTRDGEQYTYEAVSSRGEPSYRRVDPLGCLLRVHTKLVDTEDI